MAFVKTDTTANGLTTITFGHPAHNSLPSSLLSRLAEAIDTAGKQAATRLILLQSDGEGTFCAGASFDELLAVADEATGKAFFSGFADVLNAMRKCPRLIVARVQGKAVGGGVGIIAASDYAFATEKAAVKLSEISINIGPFVIAPALDRKIGLAAFTQLSLNPTQFFDAQWARHHGLFQEVCHSAIELDQAIERFCTPLLKTNPDALTALKQTLWLGTAHWNNLLYEQAAVSGRLVLNPGTKQLLKDIRRK